MLGTTPGSDPRFAYAVMAMLVGPSVTGLLMTALVSGRSGLREYLSRLSTSRVGAVWYAVALLTAPVIMLATLVALSSISPAFLPGILTTDDRTSLVLVSLAVGLSAGVLEELGWTGFAIPQLRQRYGVVATGLIVGILWTAWHLFPNVWAARAAAGDLTMPLYYTATVAGWFVGYLTAFRVLMVWCYDRTHGVFVAILMHVSLTTSLLTLTPLGIAGAPLQIFSFTFAAALWMAVGAVVLRSRTQVERRPARSSQWAA